MPCSLALQRRLLCVLPSFYKWGRLESLRGRVTCGKSHSQACRQRAPTPPKAPLLLIRLTMRHDNQDTLLRGKASFRTVCIIGSQFLVKKKRRKRKVRVCVLYILKIQEDHTLTACSFLKEVRLRGTFTSYLLRFFV